MSRKQCCNREVASAAAVSGLQFGCNQPVCLLERFTRDNNPPYSCTSTQASFYNFLRAGVIAAQTRTTWHRNDSAKRPAYQPDVVHLGSSPTTRWLLVALVFVCRAARATVEGRLAIFWPATLTRSEQNTANHYFKDKGRDALTGITKTYQCFRRGSLGVLTPVCGVVTPEPQGIVTVSVLGSVLEDSP